MQVDRRSKTQEIALESTWAQEASVPDPEEFCGLAGLWVPHGLPSGTREGRLGSGVDGTAQPEQRSPDRRCTVKLVLRMTGRSSAW